MAHLELKPKVLVSFSTLFSFTFFFSDHSAVSANYITQNDFDYMVKLKNALTPPPSDWSNILSICAWSGVNCSFPHPPGPDPDIPIDDPVHPLIPGYVNRIDLNSRSLTGTIPSGLNTLSCLGNLDLHNNSLSGPLPSLANLTLLANVSLDSNNFTSIPDGCFEGLTHLESLTLSNNVNLAPWTFPNLTWSRNLNTLNLVATNLMGSVPEMFGSFPGLQTLLLSNNNLTGVLPNSFAWSKVATLHLNDQHYGLSGAIEVLSSMPDLSELWLQGNLFEGPIPDMSHTSLKNLYLSDNRLTGVVPKSLMSLPFLEEVYLENNSLQGPMPASANMNAIVNFGDNTSNSFCLNDPGPCDRRVTTLLEIAAAFGYPYLLARSWKGNNPCHNWSFIVCARDKIRTVNLTNQNLTGTISPAFGNLTDLWQLYLGGNNLTGPIPESLATLPQLKALDVSNNNLSGNIPKFSPTVMFNATGNAFLGSPEANRTNTWIAGVLAASVGVIVIFVVVVYNRKRCHSLVQNMIFKKTTFADHSVEDFIKSYGLSTPKRYSYSEVKRMTNSFRYKLGEGGYGTVYKASLTDGCQVAVKILSESKGSGEEFINEVASISKTSHVNIVSLLGFCYEMNKRALIYEFMPNGSLDKFIYKNGFPTAICNLDWNTLYRIAISIARGLEYLHQGCSTKILHLDIKPQNILLDEDFCPKIADFGLAKTCKKKESVVSIPGTRGTPGYMAPEVFSRAYGKVSHKSDVYSYGMLILEVVGGRKKYDSGGSHTSEIYFPDWIYKDLEQGNIPARCSAKTKEENDMVMKITLVSLWCIQTNPLDRPSISKVAEMLEGPLQSVPYPPKPVLFSPERSVLQFSNVSYNSTHETISITE